MSYTTANPIQVWFIDGVMVKPHPFGAWFDEWLMDEWTDE
jgi:hypothetical protein